MKNSLIAFAFAFGGILGMPSSAEAYWYACESKKDFDAYVRTQEYLTLSVTGARPKSFKGRFGGTCRRINKQDPVDRIKKSSWHYCVKTPAWSDCLWIQKRFFDLYYKKQGRPHYYRIRGS